MRKRELRTGLVVELKNGERGVTCLREGELAIDFHSVYGPEGYSLVKQYNYKDIKLISRVYNPHDRS